MKLKITILMTLVLCYPIIVAGQDGDFAGEGRTPITIGGLKYYLNEDTRVATVANG